jgi:HlyD family secretion protein
MQQDQIDRPQGAAGGAVPGGARTLDAIIGEAAPRAGRGRRVLRWSAIGLAVVVAGYFAWSYLSSGTTYDYRTQKVARGDLTVVVTATGTVQPVAKVDVSTAISGIVRKVNVDYNSPVVRGDVLAELDTDTLAATAAAARARLVVAEANVAKAKAAHEASVTTYERQASLFNKGFMSAQTLQDTQLAMNANAAALKASEAEVLVAQADLKLAETNLAKALITSPIDGVVLTRNIDEGSTVAASLQAPVLFTIAGDLQRMEVQVDVDEADIGKVAVDQQATFSVDAYPNRSFPAQITNIRFVSETINNVVTYKALLKVDNEQLLLRPGMTATAEIVVGAALHAAGHDAVGRFPRHLPSAQHGSGDHQRGADRHPHALGHARQGVGRGHRRNGRHGWSADADPLGRRRRGRRGDRRRRRQGVKALRWTSLNHR